MFISCIGIDYNLADIELRGKVAFTESKYSEVYINLLGITGVHGCIIISTCNRTELYIHSQDNECTTLILSYIGNYFNLDIGDLNKFFVLDFNSAIHRIFKVATGVESMILGEDQILSQVKDSHKRALKHNASSGVLNRLFREAITCAKEVRHRTAISQNKLSIASIAVDVINRHFTELGDKSALVVGVGEMSKLTIKGLYSKGMGKIYLANRTHDNSNLLLEEFPELNIIGFDNRYEVLKDIDVLVSSTSAPHIVFDYEKFKKHYNERNVLLIDLAVPRDIDVAIEGLDNIVAYNIDYFKEISSSNVLFRKQMLVEAEKIIEGYMVGLNQWLKDRSIHGLLSKVDKYVEDNVEEQVEGLLYKLDCNDYMSKEEVKAFALKLSNKLLKKMVLKIKGVEQRDTEEYVGMLHELLE